MEFLGCEFIFPYVVFSAYLVCTFAIDSSCGLTEAVDRAAAELCGTKGSIPLAIAALLPMYLLHLVSALPFLLLPCLVYLILGGCKADSALYFAFCFAATPFIPLTFSYALSTAVRQLKGPRGRVFKAAASLVAAGGMFIYDLPFLLSVNGLFAFHGFLRKFLFPAVFFERALSGSFGFFVLYLTVALAFALLLFVLSLRNIGKISEGRK